MILYHVSTDCNHNGYFIPKVPKNLGDGVVDNTIPRICFSETISDCLSSIFKHEKLLRLHILENGPLFKVFVLNTSIINVNILTPEQIKERFNYSLLYKEYWIMEEIECKDYFIINLKDFSFTEDEKIINKLTYSFSNTLSFTMR